MRDYSGMFLEFAKFYNLVESKGRVPTESDIDYFIEEFLTTEYGFLFDGAFIYSAKRRDPETRLPTLDPKGASYSELELEVKPLLVAKIKEIHNELGTSEAPFEWDPEPIGIDELAARNALNMGVSKAEWNNLSGTERRGHEATTKAVAHLNKVKSRVREFNEKAIPFILRQTMNHPLAAGIYSTTTGKGEVIRTDEDGEPFIVSDEKELQKYLSSATIDGFPAAQDARLRYLWFVPSPTGQNIKVAIIDIDNPANLPDKTVRKGVAYVAKKLEENGHPHIIMFTGSSYQVWFTRNNYQDLGSIADARTLVASLMYNKDMFEIGDGKARNKAIDKRLLWIDDTGFTAGTANRMFFNLHYPSEKSQKKFSGLVSIPVGLGDIEKRFDPLNDAHPEAVLKHFDRYASIVSQFFDIAQMGQDYELEAPPPCKRYESKDPEHSLLSHLVENSELIKVPAENIEAMLEDEEEVVCYIKERGVSAVLHYNAKGSIRVGGKTLSTKTIKKSGGTSIKSESVKAILITSNGTVVYDDFICRDIERYCEAKNIRKLTLVGSIVKRDMYGNNQGAQSVRSIIERKDDISSFEARELNFASYKLVEFDKSVENLPLGKQLEELKNIQSSRIIPTTYFPLKGEVASNAKRLFRDLLVQRKVGSLVVVGDESYLITSRRTIKAVIMGIDKSSSLYKTDAPSIPPVFLAVTKKHSKFGPIYITIGKAQVVLPKAQRAELKRLVKGEMNTYEDREGNTVTSYENVIPLKTRIDSYAEDIEIVEPKVVVEVQYDDISPIMKAALPHNFISSPTGRKFRPVAKKLWVTGLIGAQVIGITDLSPTRTGDVSITQDVLLESSGKKPPKGMSILDALPNPRRERVLRNGAFFGVPTSRRIYIGGDYSDHWYDTKTKTWVSGVTGGRAAEIPLISKKGGLPGEFEAAWKRAEKGDPGFQVFVDPSAKTTSGSAVPYYTITGLGSMYQDAVDDVYGVGGPFGSSVITMDGTLDYGTTQMPYGKQLESGRTANKKQNLEDLKIFQAQVGKVPTSRDPELRGGDYEDQTPAFFSKEDSGYIEAHKAFEKELKLALDANKITEKEFQALLEANNILSNPVVKADAWNTRVTEYAKEFEKWKDSPDPKESWENISQGMFGAWELPILEKQRSLREAELKYALSEADMGAINSRFGEPMSGELLESVLSDLYEEEDEDDESTFEIDSE
tara:strand:+ start:5635 stop:9237 length:3603 start_codon:yes stop_codon:yes gene_type:complete